MWVALAIAAVVVGVLALVAALRARARLRLPDIDPFAVNTPWRGYVQHALSAQRRYRDVVRSARDGPVRERLADVGTRIDSAVRECWQVARAGDALDQGVRDLDLHRTQERVRRASDDAELADREAALEARLASGERLRTVALDARRRLEVLEAQLEEAVARAVELSLSGDASAVPGLGADLDQVVLEMEALRQGMEEAGRASGGAAP